MCYYQFINFVTEFLIIRYKYNYYAAKDITALRPIIAAVFLPFFSIYTVYYGKKSLILVFSSLCSILGFSLFYILPVEKSTFIYVAMFLLSLMLAAFQAVIWSSLTLLVPKEATGLAIAVSLTLENILMTTLPVLFGKINKPRTPEAFNYSLVLLIGLSVFSLVLSLEIFVFDYYFGNKILYLGENEESVLEARAIKSRNWRNYILKVKVDYSQYHAYTSKKNVYLSDSSLGGEESLKTDDS